MAVDAFLEATWESRSEPLNQGERLSEEASPAASTAAGEPPFEVARTGTLEKADWAVDDDLVVQVLLETLGRSPFAGNAIRPAEDGARVALRGRLTLHSTIPLARGLGSSAAARVAGSVLGRLLSGEVVDRHEVLADASSREGHPDNAAPAVLGGLVAATLDGEGGVTAVPLPLSLRLGWVFAAPGVTLATEKARAALPERIPVQAAIRNTGRLALLLPALATGDGPLLSRAMEDELHVPYRLPLIPGAREAVEAARQAGAWAVTLSGAGSGLLAAVPRGSEEAVGEAMVRTFRRHSAAEGGSWRVLRPWAAGTQWGFGPLRAPGPEGFATSPG